MPTSSSSDAVRCGELKHIIKSLMEKRLMTSPPLGCFWHVGVLNLELTSNLSTSASNIQLPLLKFGQLQQAASYFETQTQQNNNLQLHNRLSTNPHHLHVSDIRQTSTSSTVRMLYVKNTRQQSATHTTTANTDHHRNNYSIQKSPTITRRTKMTTESHSGGDNQVANFNKQLDLRLGLKGKRTTMTAMVATKPPTVISGKNTISSSSSSSAGKKSVVSQQRLRRTLSLSATGRRSQKSPSPHNSKSKSQQHRNNIVMDNQQQNQQSKYKQVEYKRTSTETNEDDDDDDRFDDSEQHITSEPSQQIRLSLSDLITTNNNKLPSLVVEDTTQLQHDMGSNMRSLTITDGEEEEGNTSSNPLYNQLIPRQTLLSTSPTNNNRGISPTSTNDDDAMSDCSSIGSARRDDASIGSRMDEFVDENGEGGLGDDFYDDDMMIGNIDDDDDYEDDDDDDNDSGSGSNTTVSLSTSVIETDMDREPALIPSLFHNCPPVINFVTEGQAVEKLPREVRKKLKWKFGTTMPVVVKNTVKRSGFKRAKKKDDWIGYYGKHMKGSAFKEVKLYQKVNHIPGSFQMGRKDRLWRNVHRCAIKYGKKEFSFLPQTYCLPQDRKLLRSNWDESKKKEKYILKPPASARGIGIKVICKWNQIPAKKPCIVQKYLSKPLLINEAKFDIRLYVYVSSYDPLRCYLYEDGLARFATHKYSSATSDIGNKFMHLTNYSINKKSGLFEQNDDVTQCVGHKWSLMALLQYLRDKGHNTSKLLDQIKDIIIKTLISIEHWTNREIKINCRKPQICHEVFGFDVMLDANLRPWILEVNVSPSLHSNSELDSEIKGGMVKDMFNIAGYQIPSSTSTIGRRRSNISPTSSAYHLDRTSDNLPNYSTFGLPLTDKPSFHKDRKKILQQVSYAAKSKQNYFSLHYKSWTQEEVNAFMLGKLTANDIRILCESEDELSRCGRFQRLYPTTSKKYLRFFDQIRYFNVLLHCWESKYENNRDKGIRLLQTLCRKNLNKLISRDEEAKGPPIIWSNYVNGKTSQHTPVVRSVRSTIDSRRSTSSRSISSSSNRSRKSPAIISSKSSPGIPNVFLTASRQEFNSHRLTPPIPTDQQRAQSSSETPTTSSR